MKKLFIFLIIIASMQSVYAQTVYDDNYVENPNYLSGLKYLESSQYTSAISEFKKAIRTNYNDTSALIGLANAYNMRAVYYNNSANDSAKAISDLKSALFYLKYFSSANKDFSAAQSITATENNLVTLETSTNSGLNPESRINTAKNYRLKGEFAAAAFDYYQLTNDSKYSEQANVALGDIYKILNRPDKAVTFYRNAIKIKPENTEAHLSLARTYEQLNDSAAALTEYSYALNTSSEREDILNSLERIWQQKVDENPKDAESHANLGVVYQKQKRFNEALEEYKKAEALNPSNINTKINIGTLYQELKEYNKAISIYDDILKLQPQNVKLLVSKAECLKALNKNEASVAVYKTALNLDHKNNSIKASLFELLKDTMPTEDVLGFLYKNVQNSPMDSNSYYEFAYELHKANKIDDAITYYLETIKLDKNNIDAYINLSQAYRQKSNINSAYNIINKAKEIAPNNDLVLKQYKLVEQEYSANIYTIASNAYESGDYQAAIKEYSRINPPTVDSYVGIAASYQSLKQYNKAIEFYQQAMNLDAKNSDLPFYIASIYANQDDLVNAKKYIDLSLSKNANNSKAKDLLNYINSKQNENLLTNALNLYEQQKYQEAIDQFTKVLAVTPDNATVYYYRAMAYDSLNNYQKAIPDYKATLKYAPDMIIAYYSLGVDYDAIGKYSDAKSNYQMFVDKSTTDDDYKKYAQSRIDEIK